MLWRILCSFILMGVVVLPGCGSDETPQPEEACHFQQNKYKQRVSWRRLPVVLNTDASMDADRVESLKKAIEIWNDSTKLQLHGQTAFVFGETISGNVERKDDGRNIVSLTKSWDSNPAEQAETVLIWYKKDIRDADIRLNGLKPLSTVNYVEDNQLDTVALLVHELGHVLGLIHIEDDRESVMAATLSLGSKNHRRIIGAAELDALKCEY